MNGILTPADKALIACSVAGILGIGAYQWRSDPGTTVVVEVEGRLWGVEPLARAQTLRLTGAIGETQVEIDGQGARFVAAPCPEKVCIHQGWIQRRGELAACIPNQVVLRIAGADEAVDAVSR